MAGLHGCDRVLVAAPRVGIVRFGMLKRVACLVWRLGPFLLAVFRGAFLPTPDEPARLRCQWLQRRRKVCEIFVVCVRFVHHTLRRILVQMSRSHLACFSVSSPP